MKYQAIFERSADGTVSGYVNEIPGAVGSGDTLDEARASVEEAVRIWIEDAIADGETIPEPSTIAAVEISVNAA